MDKDATPIGRGNVLEFVDAALADGTPVRVFRPCTAKRAEAFWFNVDEMTPHLERFVQFLHDARIGVLVSACKACPEGACPHGKTPFWIPLADSLRACGYVEPRGQVASPLKKAG